MVDTTLKLVYYVIKIEGIDMITLDLSANEYAILKALVQKAQMDESTYKVVNHPQSNIYAARKQICDVYEKVLKQMGEVNED
jgi:hypothetical protein